MYSGTQKSYGSRSGMQASQFVSRDSRVSDSTALRNLSENFNRFLSAHSIKTANHTSRKFRLNEYFSKDLKAKRFSTHHFLCGPLNTKRLTRKTISGNFDDKCKTQPLNVADMYNNSNQINNKPPWIEQSRPNGLVSKDQVFQDCEVPVDLNDSCPLYNGNEFEQCPSAIDEEVSEDENSEPDISRYNFFVGSGEKLSNVDDNFEKENDRRIRCKPLPREKVFVPLLTSSQDYDFSIIE